MESGQKVYLGEDLPGEYSYSKSSKAYKEEKFKVKGQIAQGLHEAIEIATNRKWEKNTKNKHEIDAKYGWYKYETRLKVNNTPYSAVLLIRNDANGKKYLYDVLSVNKTGTTREASNLDGSAMNGNSSYTNNTIGADESQVEIAYKDADVPNTPLADALGDIDINSIYENGENDAGNEWQAARQPLSQPSADSSPYTGEPMELKGRGEFDSDEAYAHYLNEEGQKELAKIPKITRAFLSVIAKRSGLKFVIGDTAGITGVKSAGGYSRSRDTVVLDYDTVQSPEKLARAVINHELVHVTETSMFYKSLEKHAFEQMFGGDENVLNDAIKNKQERYAGSGVTLDKAGAEAELVARYIGESLLTRPEAVDLFVKQNRSLARQVYEGLVDTYNRVKTYFADRDSYEARYALSDIEQGIRLFEKAFGTRRTALDEVSEKYGWNGGNVGGDVQYMFTPKVDGDIVAKAEKMEAEGRNSREIWKDLKIGRGLDGQWRKEIDDSKAIFSRKGDLDFAEGNPDYKEYRELYDAKARNALGLEGGRVLSVTEEQRYEKLKTIWGNTFKKNGRITEDANVQDKLSAYLKHDELYKEYPRLKDLTVVFDETMESGNWGKYNRQNKTITLNPKQANEDMKRTLLHEVMHAIQDYEGLARGSSVDYWENEKRGAERARKVLNWIKELKETSKENPDVKDIFELNNILRQEYATMNMNEFIPNGEIQGEAIQKYYSDSAIKDLQDKVSYFGFNKSLSGRDTYDLYRNTAGEIEARDVSSRADMSAEQRIDTFPESMKPNENVVFSEEGYNASEKRDGKGPYWKIETGKDIFKGIKNDKKALQKRAYEYFMSKNKRFVKDGIIDGENLIFVAELGRKYVYGDHSNNLNDLEYAQKLRILPSIYDLIEHSNVSWTSPNAKPDSKSKLTKYKKDGVRNYRGRVKIDNSYFSYVVRVGKSDFGNVMYELNLDAENATRVSDNDVASPTLNSTSSNFTLSQNGSVVKSDFQFSSPVAAEVQQEFGNISTRRAYDYFKKNRNAYKKEIGRMFGVPGKDLSVLDADIDAYAKEYFENGAVSEETKNRLFDEAWANGIRMWHGAACTYLHEQIILSACIALVTFPFSV